MEQDSTGAWHTTMLGEGTGPTWMASPNLFGLAAAELTEGLRSGLLAEGARIEPVAGLLGRNVKSYWVSFFEPADLEGQPQPLGLALPWREGEWTTHETALLLTVRVSKHQFATFSQATLEASGAQAFEAIARAHGQTLPLRLVAVGPLAASSKALAACLNVPLEHRDQAPRRGWRGSDWRAMLAGQVKGLQAVPRGPWLWPWAMPLGVLMLAWLLGLLAPQGPSSLARVEGRPSPQQGVGVEPQGAVSVARSAQALVGQVERVAQVVERVQGPRLEWLVLERLSPGEVRLDIRVGPPRLGAAASGAQKEAAGERLEAALAGLPGLAEVRVSNRTGDEVSMVVRLLEPLPPVSASWDAAAELARANAVALSSSPEEGWVLQAPAQPADRLLTFLPRLLSQGFDWGRLVMTREGDGLASLRLEGAPLGEGQAK